MDLYDVRQARSKAAQELEVADKAVQMVANLICNRLRASNVNHPVLRDLKRELKDYNIHTGKWRDK